MTFTFTEDQFVALVNESPTFRKHVIALATPESDRIPELLKELKTRIANTYSPENKIGRIKKLRELVQTEPRFQVLFERPQRLVWPSRNCLSRRRWATSKI
jgi:hypothetical protein